MMRTLFTALALIGGLVIGERARGMNNDGGMDLLFDDRCEYGWSHSGVASWGGNWHIRARNEALEQIRTRIATMVNLKELETFTKRDFSGRFESETSQDSQGNSRSRIASSVDMSNEDRLRWINANNFLIDVSDVQIVPGTDWTKGERRWDGSRSWKASATMSYRLRIYGKRSRDALDPTIREDDRRRQQAQADDAAIREMLAQFQRNIDNVSEYEIQATVRNTSLEDLVKVDITIPLIIRELRTHNAPGVAGFERLGVAVRQEIDRRQSRDREPQDSPQQRQTQQRERELELRERELELRERELKLRERGRETAGGSERIVRKPPAPTPPRRLGIQMQVVDVGGGELGLQIIGLMPGGPAQRAGLEPGDVIVRVDGQRVRQPDEMTRALSDSNGSPTLRIRNVRNGLYQEIGVVID